MSYFILESNEELFLEAYFLKEQLNRNKSLNTFDIVDKPFLVKDDEYPVGRIPFVSKSLGVHENPIEIPKYLRTDEFLKREYNFKTWQEVPRSGVFFLKAASTLKEFGKVVNADYEITDDLCTYERKNEFDSTLVLNKNSIYIVSSLVRILSEYRVYVFQGEIEQISYYNGDCTVFPDLRLINKAVELINYNEKWLRSYTIDVAVTDNGTCLLEVHNFTSCGLYSVVWGSNLIQAYKDGIEYLRNDNSKLEI